MSSRPPAGSGQGGHIAASFTDLMASMMVIFVLLFVAVVNNASAKRDLVVDELLKSLRERMGETGLAQRTINKDPKDPYAILVIMPDSLLFERGKAEIGIAGRTDLNSFMPLVAGVLCAPETRDRVTGVVVEGHTDSTWHEILMPPETGPERNLELSQSRSMEVVKTSLRALEGNQHQDCFRQMLSASGRGQEELLPEIGSDDAKQRRVVFKIRVQQDALSELATAVVRPTTGAR